MAIKNKDLIDISQPFDEVIKQMQLLVDTSAKLSKTLSTDLKKSLEDLSKSPTGDLQKKYEDTKISLEKANKEFRENKALLNELKKIETASMRLQAQKITIDSKEYKANRELNEELRRRKKSIEDDVKLARVHRDSLAAKEIKLRQLKQQYRESGSAIAQQMLPQIKKLDTEVKKLNADMGNHQGNVGNYGSALNDLHPALGGAVNGVQRLGSALKVLLISPLGLVVAAIGAVVGAFKLFASTDTGSSKIEAEWEGVKSALDEARQSALNGDWKKAFSILTGGFSSARKAAIEYTFTVDGINDRIAFQRGQLAQMELEISEYENKAKDRGISAQGRYNAASKAMDLRIEKLKIEKKNAEELYFAEVKRVSGLSGVQTKILDLFARGTDAQREQILASNEALRNFRENSEEELFTLSEKAAEKIAIETSYNKETKRLVSEMSSLKIQLAKETADEEIRQIKRVAEYEKSQIDLQIETTEDLYERIRIEEEKGKKDFEARFDEQEKLMQKHLADRMGADALPEFQMEYETQLNIISSEYLKFQNKIQAQRDAVRQKEGQDAIKQLDIEKNLYKSRYEYLNASELAIYLLNLEYENKKIELQKRYGLISEDEYETYYNNLIVKNREYYAKLKKTVTEGEEKVQLSVQPKSVDIEIQGKKKLSKDEMLMKFLGVDKNQLNELKSTYSELAASLDEIFMRMNEKWQRVINSFNTKISEQNSIIEREQEAMMQGQANTYEQEKQRLLELQAVRDEAVEREKQNNIIQLRLQQAEKLGALSLAAANLLKNGSKLGPIGIAAAGISALGLIGTMAAVESQIQGLKKYREGGLLEGASHENGGVLLVNNGRAIAEAEGGEFILNREATKNSPIIANMINEHKITDREILPALRMQRELRLLGIDENTNATKDLTKALMQGNEIVAGGYKVRRVGRNLIRSRI